MKWRLRWLVAANAVVLLGMGPWMFGCYAPHVVLGLDNGCLVFQWTREPVYPYELMIGLGHGEAWLAALARTEVLWYRGDITVAVHMLWLFLPLAFLTGLVWWCAQALHTGHCTRCEYDLTGNTSGRCPECGGVAAAASGETP